MSAVLIVYLVTVAIAFVLLVAAGWADAEGASPELDAHFWAVFSAVLGCGAGPVVLLAFAGIWAAQREPRHIHRARKAAEVAEYAAREAEAVAARERALGMR